MEVEDIPYHWNEYVLFNPYKGFRYLTEYNGHWNDAVICKELPIVDPRLSTPLTANYLGEVYKHFHTADANTDFFLGEFPSKVRPANQPRVPHNIHPPPALP